MPRAKLPYNLKRQRGLAAPLPLTVAVQSWLLVRGLNDGPHRERCLVALKYRAVNDAGVQVQLMGAQVLHEISQLFNF